MPDNAPRIRNYYVNENKRFPIEYIFIPILILGALYGGWIIWNNVQISRTPIHAATMIMTAIQTNDIEKLGKWVNMNDQEAKSLELQSTPADIYKNCISLVSGKQIIIKSFKVTPTEASGESVQVPVRVEWAPAKGGKTNKDDIILTLDWRKAQWWVTTDNLKNYFSGK